MTIRLWRVPTVTLALTMMARMPRLPRLHVRGGCYHVILRGNHRENLFATAQDRTVLEEIVAAALERFNARLHVYCWMTNHGKFVRRASVHLYRDS